MVDYIYVPYVLLWSELTHIKDLLLKIIEKHEDRGGSAADYRFIAFSTIKSEWQAHAGTALEALEKAANSAIGDNARFFHRGELLMQDYIDSLKIIGWTERELSRQLSKPHSTVRQWLAGTAAMPADVAAWLNKLAKLHKENPPPAPIARPSGRPALKETDVIIQAENLLEKLRHWSGDDLNDIIGPINLLLVAPGHKYLCKNEIEGPAYILKVSEILEEKSTWPNPYHEEACEFALAADRSGQILTWEYWDSIQWYMSDKLSVAKISEITENNRSVK